MATKSGRLADRLLLVTNLVVANGAAAVFVVAFAQPTALGLGIGPIDGPVTGPGLAANRMVLLPLDTGLAWALLALSIVLLLWNFAWLVRRREQAPPSNWVISDTPSGPVRVAREALESGLQKAGESLVEITRVRVQVDTRTPKRIGVTVQFQAAEGSNNLAASQRLRQVVGDRFAEMVRLYDDHQVDYELEFQGFAGKLGKKGLEVPPPSEPHPFTGPKYPIDDDTTLGGGA
jgi:hypothetical protein